MGAGDRQRLNGRGADWLRQTCMLRGFRDQGKEKVGQWDDWNWDPSDAASGYATIGVPPSGEGCSIPASGSGLSWLNPAPVWGKGVGWAGWRLASGPAGKAQCSHVGCTRAGRPTADHQHPPPPLTLGCVKALFAAIQLPVPHHLRLVRQRERQQLLQWLWSKGRHGHGHAPCSAVRPVPRLTPPRITCKFRANPVPWGLRRRFMARFCQWGVGLLGPLPQDNPQPPPSCLEQTLRPVFSSWSRAFSRANRAFSCSSSSSCSVTCSEARSSAGGCELADRGALEQMRACTCGRGGRGKEEEEVWARVGLLKEGKGESCEQT